MTCSISLGSVLLEVARSTAVLGDELPVGDSEELISRLGTAGVDGASPFSCEVPLECL